MDARQLLELLLQSGAKYCLPYWAHPTQQRRNGTATNVPSEARCHSQGLSKCSTVF